MARRVGAGAGRGSGQTLVGLDVGTSSVKAVGVTPDGQIVGRAEEQYGLQTPKPGWAEQDPEVWWQAAERALASLGGEPLGIGLTGQMHGLVCMGSEDHPLRPAILWNDQRTAVQCAQIEDTVGHDRLVRLTGNRALPGFTAPKLLWLREHEPEVYARISHICLPKDYVRFRLTGERTTDVADASGTLLFDVAARDWSGELVEALGIPTAWLPKALESPEISGVTRSGVPVAAGASDQAAGALGVGACDPGDTLGGSGHFGGSVHGIAGLRV